MTTGARVLSGWPIVGVFTLVVITLVTAAVLSAPAPVGLERAVRGTARMSFLLFSATFVAAALHRALRHPVTAWMLRHRRQLGVSFAVVHLVHAFTLLAKAITTGTRPPVVSLLGGGLVYLLILAMAATSFDRTAAWLGRDRWRQLHTVGVHVLWFAFLVAYLGRTTETLAWAPLLLISLGSMGLRLAYRRGSSRAPLRAAA